MYNKKIDVYEKSFSVKKAFQLYEDGKILFPEAADVSRKRKMEKISETIESVLIGLALPAIYVSQLQNGRYLVLDTSDRLKYLFEFLKGNCDIGFMELYPELQNCSAERMEVIYPSLIFRIYEAPVRIQIIDYSTPKYLQIQAGKYIEKWNYTREQGIRNLLYSETAVLFLEKTASDLCKNKSIFSRSKLNCQYMVLRILMYHFVLEKDIVEEAETGMQVMLDRSMHILEEMCSNMMGNLYDDLIRVGQRIEEWNYHENYCDRLVDLSAGKGKESQIRLLSWLYNAVWYCMKEKGDFAVDLYLEKILAEKGLVRMVLSDAVNMENIQMQGRLFKERLKRNVE